MILKHLKKTTPVLLLMSSHLLIAANDTIVKANRFIPKNYKENYTADEYIYTIQEPGFLLALKIWFKELILSLLNNVGVGMNTDAFKYLKLVFYFLIFVAAVYIIVRMFFYKEGNWIFRKNKHQNNLTYENEVEIIETANFKTLIEKAIKKEDYRLAVKFNYLWILQKLAENKIIELSNLKTNADYQLETEETPYAKEFNSISYYYNYIWYGEFMIDKTAYEKIEATYNELLNNIKS
ncbi:hypothetical protein [Wenyingzhuangia sp. IMCC45467]